MGRRTGKAATSATARVDRPRTIALYRKSSRARNAPTEGMLRRERQDSRSPSSKVIVDYALRWNAALILIGTHDRSLSAPVPVLLFVAVRRTEHAPHPRD